MSITALPKQPVYAFYVGLALVMLSLWMWFIPNWLTFIHNWRVELFASVFLLATLVFILFRSKDLRAAVTFSTNERNLVILPLLAFITWSAISAIWAPSWRSAIHHSLVWSEYLIFYCIVRYLLEQPGQYRRLLYVFAGTLLLYSLPAISGYIALSLFGGTNRLGMGFARFGEQVVLVLPLVLVAAVRLEGRRFILGTVAVVLLWLFMFSTFGRTNYILVALAVILTGIVIFLISSFRDYRSRFAAIVVTLMVVTTIAVYLPAISPPNEQSTQHRFRNSEGLVASNDFRKLMMTLSAEMIYAHPIVGIGADNFGFEVDNYRQTYAAQNPSDANLAAAENELPERAHNEYLQVFAELGIVGIAIFAWFLFGVTVVALSLLRHRRHQSLHAYAAVIGIALFLASSLVSSYSFRLIQNGFVFFFVLAIATKLLLRDTESPAAVRQPPSPRLAIVGGIVACLLLAVYSSTRVASVILSERANSTRDMDSALSLYRTAIGLDPENPEANRVLGMRHFHREEYSQAAEHLSRSIDKGIGTSTNYSYLASAYSLAGDNEMAEETMRQAAVIYPRSIFALVRHASLQEQNNRQAESEITFARAVAIDPKLAKTWRSMITQGAKVTSDNSVHDPDILPVMELTPATAIYAVNIERLIRFPEERKFSMMRIGGGQEDLSAGN